MTPPVQPPASGPLAFRTLRSQALIIVGISVIGATLVAYQIFSPIFARTFDLELEKRGNAMTKILEKNQDLRLALSLVNQKQAAQVARQVKEGNPDVRYVILLDAQKNVLGSEGVGQEELNGLVAEHLRTTSRGGEFQRFTKQVNRGEVSGLDAMPFASDEVKQAPSDALGWILLGLSASGARRQLSLLALSTIAVTAIPLALAFLIFLARMANRLKRISGYAAEVEGGNLIAALEPQGEDEIGQLSRSLIALTDKNAMMVARLQRAAQELANASTDILESSTRQGESASRQAASVSQTGATVAELRETFKQASDRAQAVIELAKRTVDSTAAGKRAVGQSVDAMEQNREQVAVISRTMLGLVERTNQISTIIDAVNDLAEQSNVLALNAAIEAAKAGDQGRGFAVVAREVRALAERSKDSTGQIRAILQDIERASRDALGVIEEGQRRAQAWVELANRAGASIVDLDLAIGESSTAAKQIAASTRQQAVGVEQIWQAMRDIDRAVNESATGIHQLERAAKNMKALSDQMSLLVRQYMVDGIGGQELVS